MANLLLYRLTRRGIEVTSEIVCQTHFEEFRQLGGVMAELSEHERDKRGYQQTVSPYHGPRPCEACQQDAELKAS